MSQPVLADFDLIERFDGGTWGEIWRAVQRDISRSVAIKFLAPALISVGSNRERAEQLAWRFKREIEAAAAQNHPHIARVYASGVAGGRPWFAMELVEGIPLDAFAAALPLPERLALFLKICEGVQHAHDRGVIHRDLKPANILVCEDGTPKILDFGLARFLDDSGLGHTLSLDGQTLGTPMFMAPEQAAGKAGEISVGVDVYALGVILYRLLTNAWPFDEKLSSLQLLAAARETEPVAPRSVCPALPRDLEAIILKALAKQKKERYPSVRALADDVTRFLAHEPVKARAWTLGYVWRMRVRRYWRSFATAAFILALCAGFAIAWFEQRRHAAERNTRALQQAREVVNVMLFDLHGKLNAIGQADLYADIAAQAEKLPWPVDADATGHLNLLRAQAFAASSRGDVLLGGGDAPKALEAYNQAIAHLKKLVAAYPGEPRYALDIATARLSMNTALGKARHHREAVSGLRALIASLDTLDTPEFREETGKLRAEAHRELGETLRDKGDFADSEKELSKALALFSKPPAASPFKQALIKESLGEIQFSCARPLEAITAFSEAEAYHRSVLTSSPQNRESVLALSRTLARKAAAHLALNQLAVAQLCLDEARDICPAPTEKVSNTEMNLRRRLANGYGALAKSHGKAGDDSAAMNAAREAVALWRVVFRRGSTSTSDRPALIDLRRHMAETQLRQGKPDEAANSLRIALEQGKRLTRERVDDARWFLEIAEIELQLLNLPRTPLSPSRTAQLERIAGDLSRFDELPAQAIKPHRAKAAELRARFAVEKEKPVTEKDDAPIALPTQKGTSPEDDPDWEEMPL